jgi:hypothetical protein
MSKEEEARPQGSEVEAEEAGKLKDEETEEVVGGLFSPNDKIGSRTVILTQQTGGQVGSSGSIGC